MLRLETQTWLWRLAQRFGLSESEEPDISLAQSVQPVTIVDQLMEDAEIVCVFLDISSPGFVAALDIPEDEEWELHAVAVNNQGGTGTAVSIWLRDLRGGSLKGMQLHVFSATNDYGAILPSHPRLPNNHRLEVYVNAVTTSWQFRFSVLVIRRKRTK